MTSLRGLPACHIRKAARCHAGVPLGPRSSNAPDSQIDPEDDEEVAQGRHLGLRAEVEARLRAAWKDVPGAKAIRRITLPYLDGRIQVEAKLALEIALGGGDAMLIQGPLEQAVKVDPDASEVRALFG